ITLTDVSATRKKGRVMSLLINNATESFLLLDKTLRIIDLNQQFQGDYKRYNNGKIERGDYILDHVAPERVESLKKLYQKALSGGLESTQHVMETTAGSLTYHVKCRAVFNEQGEIEGLVITSYEITAQINALKKTEESELRYRKLFNENPVPAWILDVETFKFLEVNGSALRK